MATILLVCTGNICRSPMAEGFLRRTLADRGIHGVTVRSAGISGLSGYPAMPEAVAAMRERGIDLSSHRARRVDRSMIGSADLVLAMAAEHRDAVAGSMPQAASRTFTIKELVHLLGRTARPGLNGRDAVGRNAEGWAEGRLGAALAVARAARGAGGASDLMDEDVPDPLELGARAFDGVAWQLEDLVDRVVDGLFDSVGPGPGGPPAGGVEHLGRTIQTKERGVR